MSENTTPGEGRTLRARVGSVTTTTRPRLYPLHASCHGVLARLAVALLLFSLLWAVGGCVEEDGPQEAAPAAEPPRELRTMTQALAVGTDMDMELAGITNWPHAGNGSSAKATDQSSSGQSLKGSSGSARKTVFGWDNIQSSIGTINATDTVTLSLWYGSQALLSATQASLTVSVEAAPAGTGSWVTLWTTAPALSTTFASATVSSQDVSSSFASTGDYDLRLHVVGATGNDAAAQVLVWWDDIVLDVTGGSAPPTVANDVINGGLAAVTHNSAPLQAEVTALGTPSSANPRGFVWNTGGSPTTSDTVCNAAGSGLGVFNQSCSFPTPGQQAFFRGYAFNGANGYTAAPGTSFFLEPLQSSSAGFGSVTASSMTVSWTNDGTAGGAVVVMKEGADFGSAPNPTDTTTYTAGGTAWNDGTILGEGRVIYVGSGTSVAVDAMAASTTYYVRVYAYAGAGANTNYQQDTPASGSQATVTPVVPTVTTPTATAIATTTATLGANVTSNGGATLTARGTCWGTSAAPTTNCVAEGSTTTGVFTQARTGLLEGRPLFYRGYATNSAGTGYSPDGTFTSEPTQVSAISFSNVTDSGMRIAWTQNSFSAGALVVLRATATAAGGDPADATTYTASTTFGSGNTIGAGNFVVFAGNGTQVDVTGLSQSTSYSVRIYALAGSGAAINYEQTSPPTGSQSTTAGPTPPLLSSPTVSTIDLTTATLGAMIDANGGSAITGRGTCWGTAPAPTGNCTSAGGTALGAFSHPRTGLSAGSLVYFRGYADNAQGRGYSADGSFYTEPSQASAVSFSALAYNGMTVSWSNHASADGAIVVIKEGSDFSVAPDPTDGTATYSAGGSAWNAGDVLGQGMVLYVGAGASVVVDGMSPSTTYYVRVYGYAGSGAAINFQQTAPASGSQITDPLPPAPTLSSPTHSSVATTTAMLGATVDTGAAMTATGTVWSSDADPTNGGAAPAAADNNANSCSSGCSTGAFSHSRTGLPVGTKVSYAGYATGLGGTGYSAIRSFYTNPNQVTAATATATGAFTIDLTWTYEVVGGGDGVVVVMREGAAPSTGVPGDGLEYASNLDFTLAPPLGDSKVVYRGSGTSQTVSGLSATTTYYIAVYAYAGTGAGATGINYQQATPKTGNATTLVDLTTHTTPGTAAAAPSSCTEITVTAPFTGDSDGDGSVKVEYSSVSPTGPWTTACAAVTGSSPRTCLVGGLSGDTAYWTQVTYTDPDNGSSSQVTSPVITATCGTDTPMVMFVSPAPQAVIGGLERFVVQVHDRDGVNSILWGIDASPVTNPVFPMPDTTCNTADQPESTCRVVYFDADTVAGGWSNGPHTITVKATDPIAYAGSGSLIVTVQNQGLVPAGSGKLLRRSVSPQLCTSCHVVQAHSSQLMSTKYGSWAMNCMTCHTPHDTANIYLIRETIDTPNSGPLTVDFRNRTGVADFSYVSATGNGTGLCEVCHTKTRFYRNSGGGTTHPSPNEDCNNCHGHTDGFAPPGCESCHGGGNNAVPEKNYWPDGQSATTLAAEDDEPGEHERHMELLSAKVFNRTLSDLKADLQTDEKQKKLCAYCHPDPFGASFDPGINQAWDDVHLNGSVQVGGLYGHRLWDSYAAPFSSTDGWTFDALQQGSCASVDCHNNTTSPAAQQWNDGAWGSCVMCHTVNPTTDTTHQAHVNAQATFGVAIDCDTCHVPGVIWGSAAPFIQHIDGAWTTNQLYTGDSISKAKGSCGINTCHNNGSDSTPRTAGYTWGSAIAGDCVPCHGDDTDTSAMSGAHTKHKSYLNTLGETGDQPCDDCHVSQTTATHMNGEVTLEPALVPPAYTGSVTVGDGGNYGRCSSGACHDVGTDLLWTDPAPTDCTACHQDSTDLNEFDGRSKVASEVALGEYTVTGHGSKAIACMQCHDISAPHDFSNNLQGGNPFRLNAEFTIGAGSPGCNNTTNAACHDALGAQANHERAQMGSPALPANAYHFTPGCLSCHDPHGDGPTTPSPQLKMIGREIFEVEFNVPNPPDTTTFACPGGTCLPSGLCTGGTRTGQVCVVENSTLAFTDNVTGMVVGGHANEVDFSGLCQECHETTDSGFTSFKDDTSPAYELATHVGPPYTDTCFVVDACHDLHDKGFGPPLSCGACHPSPPATEAHVAHVNSGFVGCVDCHPSPGAGAGHRETAGINDVATWDVFWADTSPGGGRAQIRNNTQVAFAPAKNPNGTYTGSDRNTAGVYGTCNATYCHGADTTTFPAGAQGTDTTPQWNVPSTGVCGTCHKATTANPPATAAHVKHSSTTSGYGIACNVCHVATTTNGIAVTAPLLHTNKLVEVAFDTNDPRLDGSSAYAGTNTVGDSLIDNTDTCNNTYCHSPGNDTTAPFTQGATAVAFEWDDTLGCGGCHGDGSNGALPAYGDGSPKSNKHVRHVTANGYGCERCHYSTTTTGGTVTDKAKHVDLAYAVDDQPAGPALGDFTYGGGSCTNTPCHGGNSVAWGDGVITCDVCHSEVGGSTVGVADVNNFSFGDAGAWIQSKVSNNGEYANYGHGKVSPSAVPCAGCHDSATEHDTTNNLSGANPFRLVDQNGVAGGVQFSCTDNSPSCHDGNPTASVATAVNHTSAAMLAAGHVPQVDIWTFTPECMSCHDPHGDGSNLHMIQKELYEDDGASGSFTLPTYPSGLTIENSNLVFTDDSTGSNAAGTSYADTDTPFSSLCQECHESSDPDLTSYRDGATASSTGHPTPGGNPGDCSACHKHETGFKPSGCSGCHGGGSSGAVADAYWPDGSSGNEANQDGAHTAHMTQLASRVYGQSLAQLLDDASADNKQLELCSYCHNTPGQDADHAVTMPADVNSLYEIWEVPRVSADNGVWNAGTGQCSNVDCHNNVTTPVANQWYASAGNSACSMCHSVDPTADTTHLEHATALAQYGISITCDSCHANGVVWPTTAPSAAAGHIDGQWTIDGGIYNGNSVTKALGTCGMNACHNNGQGGNPARNPYPWKTPLADDCASCHLGGTMATDAHDTHLGSNAMPNATNINECYACHSTSTTSGGFASGSQHLNGSNQVAFAAAYNYQNGTASRLGSAGTSTCATVRCHSGVTSPTWNDTTLTCWDCHNTSASGPLPSAASISGSHAAHANNDANYSDCADCHPGSGAYTATGPSGSSTHQDLVVNMSFTYTELGGAGGVAYGGSGDVTDNGTCSSTGCHGAGTPTWGGTLSGGCFDCHTGAEPTARPVEAVDGVPNPVDSTQYANAGHGNIGTHAGSGTSGAGYTVGSNGCNLCHASGSSHTPKSATDPYRLGAYASNTNGLCDTCHGPGGSAGVVNMEEHTKAFTGSARTWPSNYDFKCVDCHEPHGDGNYQMVRSHISAPTSSGDTSFGSNGYGTPQDTGNLQAVTFTSMAGLAANSYAVPGAADGICEVCHTQTTPYNASGSDNAGTHVGNTGDCSQCHDHAKGFQGAGDCGGCHGTTSGDVDDFADQNGDGITSGIKAMVDMNEWAAQGHGRVANYPDPSGTPNPGANFDTRAGAGQDPCLWCHDAGATDHANYTTNPYRLKSINALGNGPNDNCLYCHDTGQTTTTYKAEASFSQSMNLANVVKVDKWHSGADHATNRDGGLFCWDCHDPHGDSSNQIMMIQKYPTKDNTDATHGVPSGAADIDESTPIIFTDNTVADGVGGFARSSGTYKNGICNACHTNSTSNPKMLHYNSTASDSHKTGIVCTSCHKHNGDTSNDGQAFKGAADGPCTDAACHGTTQGSLRQITGSVGDFTATMTTATTCTKARDCTNIDPTWTCNVSLGKCVAPLNTSHHVNNGDGLEHVTRYDCVLCHMEGDVYSAAVDATYHMNSTIDVRNVDHADTPYTTGTSYRYDDWFNIGAAARSDFCMSCHDSDGASVLTGNPRAGVALDPAAADGIAATPLNPYNDGLTNYHEPAGFDGSLPPFSRGQVVDVKSQFALTNPSHHAGLGQAYSTDPSGLTGIFQAYKLPSNPTGPNVNWNSRLECEDCHYGDATTKLSAHGSTYSRYYLRDQGGNDTTAATSYTMCLRCHKDPSTVATAYSQHAKGGTHWNDVLNIYGIGCLNCHGGGYSDGGETVKYGAIHGTTDTSVSDDNGGGTYIPYAFTYGSGIDSVSVWTGTAPSCSSRNGLPSSQINDCGQHGSSSYTRTSGARTYTPLN